MALTIASRAPLVVSLLKKQLTALSQSSALSPDLFEELHELRKTAWPCRRICRRASPPSLQSECRASKGRDFE